MALSFRSTEWNTNKMTECVGEEGGKCRIGSHGLSVGITVEAWCLCFAILFYLFSFSVLLQYNLHTIQVTHCTCTIQGLLVYSEWYIHSTILSSSPQKETSHTSAIIPQIHPTLGPRQPPIYFLSLQIPLLWTFPIKWIPQYEVLCDRLIHGVARIKPSFLFIAQ